jgi:RimJ/RimL family protein N-acetyltransferase
MCPTGYALHMSHADIVLRPARSDDLPLLERQFNDPDAGGRFNWSGYTSQGRLRQEFEESGFIGPDSGRLIVAQGDDSVGNVAWRKVYYGKLDWWCWNIGISLLPGARGRGIGTQAQRLLVEYLFNVSTAERIEAYTDIENIAEQRALERVGFTKEGTIRSAQFRGGRWRSLVMYGILKDEFKPAEYEEAT